MKHHSRWFQHSIIAPELGLGLGGGGGGGGGYNNYKKLYDFRQFENCIHNLL